MIIKQGANDTNITAWALTSTIGDVDWRQDRIYLGHCYPDFSSPDWGCYCYNPDMGHYSYNLGHMGVGYDQKTGLPDVVGYNPDLPDVEGFGLDLPDGFDLGLLLCYHISSPDLKR